MSKKNKKKIFKEEKQMEENNMTQPIDNTIDKVEDTIINTEVTTEEVTNTEGEVTEIIEEVEETPESNQPVIGVDLGEGSDVHVETNIVTENNEPEENTENKDEEDPFPGLISGIIDGCDRLNIRSEASKTSDIIGTITKEDTLVIDENKSTEDFYKVTTSNGLDGYCVKQFVKID